MKVQCEIIKDTVIHGIGHVKKGWKGMVEKSEFDLLVAYGKAQTKEGK